jgi:hypothetical protein
MLQTGFAEKPLAKAHRPWFDRAKLRLSADLHFSEDINGEEEIQTAFADRRGAFL